MARDYVVLFMNLITKKVGMDTFTAADHVEAKSSFRACYRHGNYRILSVVEIPEL
mgnify:FL=1